MFSACIRAAGLNSTDLNVEVWVVRKPKIAAIQKQRHQLVGSSDAVAVEELINIQACD